MPTKEFIIKAEDTMSAVVEGLLAQAFDPSLVARARTKGARIKLIVTVPWPKPPKKEKIIVDDAFISKLKGMTASEALLDAEIGKLNGPQLLKIGSTLGIPLSKNSKVPSLRAQLLKSLRSEVVWMGISGQDPTTGSL